MTRDERFSCSFPVMVTLDIAMKTKKIIPIAITLFTVFAAAFVVCAQTYKPGAQYESLMNMRFYEANGGFLVEDVQVVFPPGAIKQASLIVSDASGKQVAAVPLRYERMEFPAFGRFRPAAGDPGNLRIGRSGDYVMSLVVDGQPLTQMPFSLKEETSSDPFNPGKRFVRSGPWLDLAYFRVVPDDSEGQLTFSWWTSTRELPAGMKSPKVTVHLMSGGKEIAATQGAVVPDSMDWYFYNYKQLSVPGVPRAHWLTLSDVQRLNGDLTVVLKANGTPFKTYRMSVASGQIGRLTENGLGHEPHIAWISPRFIDTSSGSNSSYKMYDMYWLRAVK